MSGMQKNAIRKIIEGFRFAPSADRPHLLFGGREAVGIRERAHAMEGLLERVQERCRGLLEEPPDVVDVRVASAFSSEAQTMAEGFFLTGQEAYAEWAQRRVSALLAQRDWMAPVHRDGCVLCDHVMTNVAAQIALTHDLLGEAYTESDGAEVAEGLRRHVLLPFLGAMRQRREWWSKQDCGSNWKIMCCGEAGFAICGYVERWAEAREALALAAQGVIEVLDMVPAEGDWPEGVGYWFATLWMGLRFATALRRLTDGRVDLYQHPALEVTGDYATMLATPGGRVYNFNDNEPTLAQGAAAGLLMLAAEKKRGDWMYVARNFAADAVTYLAFDDPSMPGEKPSRAVGHFPRTGVATFRSGWAPGDTFVGFKCGPSDVGHSHLDAASFVLESGGQPLIWEEGTWPYAHFLGFFDNSKLRWNWDNMSTVGHNTLLVDGKGQNYGPQYAGRIVKVESGPGWDMVVGDAGRAYPGLLRKFVRTLCFLKPDGLVVRDVIECEGERHLEWLMHFCGEVRSEGMISVVKNGEATLTVVPLLPDREFGWRISDVVRTSHYKSSGTGKEETVCIRYRSFSPFRAADSFEFLMGLRVGGRVSRHDWEFRLAPDGWELPVPHHGVMLRPSGDSMAAERPCRS